MITLKRIFSFLTTFSSIRGNERGGERYEGGFGGARSTSKWEVRMGGADYPLPGSEDKRRLKRREVTGRRKGQLRTR